MASSRAPSLLLTIRPPLTREDLPGLCARVCRLLETTGGAIVACNVGGVAADAIAVDALARLQLAAHQRGCSVRLHHASRELLDLVAFMGLQDVLPA